MIRTWHLLGNIFYPWLGLLLKDSFKQDENWVGQRPPFALWLKFVWQSKVKLLSNTRMAWLNWGDLTQLEEQTSYTGQQQLCNNEEYEKFLLRKSNLHWNPHEVMHIRVLGERYQSIDSKVIHGKMNGVGNYKLIKNTISELVLTARKSGLKISEVQINHTHPSLELILIENNEEAKFVFHSLSQKDLDLGQMLCSHIDFPLRLKAITPQANYSILL